MRYHKLGKKEVEALIWLASTRNNPMTSAELAEYTGDSLQNSWQRLNYRLLQKGLVEKLGEKYRITKLGLDTIISMIFVAPVKPSRISNYPLGGLQKKILLALVLLRRATIPTIREKLNSYEVFRRKGEHAYTSYRNASMSLVFRGLVSRFKVNSRKVLYEITEKGVEVAREIAREEMENV